MNRLGWGESALILFWAAFFGAVFGFGVFVAFGQVNPVQLETNGDHRFPDTTSWGGYPCQEFDPNTAGFVATSIAGTQTQCTTCVDGSDPAVCSSDPNTPGTGCLVEYQDGRWRCVNRSCCVPEITCPTGKVLIGFGPDGTPICGVPSCTLDCQNGGFCVLGPGGPECLCPCPFTGGLCNQVRSTTSTTSSSTTSTTAGATTTTSSTTATTSTTLSGTTSTTSSSTTTTTLAFVNSSSFLALPSYPTDETQGTYPQGGVAQRPLLCGRFMATHTMTGITKMAAQNTFNPGLADRISWSIYPDDDNGTLLGSIDGFDVNNFGPAVVTNTTLSAFTITRGQMYRVCTCCGYNAIIDACGKYEATNWTPNKFASEQNAFVVSVGKGNACGGDPGLASPSTTGPLTPDPTIKPPIIFLSVE